MLNETVNGWPTENDLFKFDLQGFVICRGFLCPAEVEELNKILDPVCAHFAGNSKFDFVSESIRFLDLMRDRRVLSLCSAIMGAHFRFAEAWGIHGYPQNRNLHAGPFSAQGFNQYHWMGGRSICSSLVLGVFLTEQRAADGGLVILPGSHKLVKHQNGDFVFHKLFHGQMDYDCIIQPAFQPGDAIFFAEATIHGTEGWVPKDRARRNLYIKFAHAHCSFLPDDDEQLAKLRAMIRDEQDARLLEGPWVRNAGGVATKNTYLRRGTVVPPPKC